MVCSIVLLRDTFVHSGCPNCEIFLGLTGSPETVAECTSATFNGVIALTDPSRSWVAKWQRLDQFVPGTYAVQVIGALPNDVIQLMEDTGRKYIPRDGTREDEVDEE